jgi:hypothetical protein
LLPVGGHDGAGQCRDEAALRLIEVDAVTERQRAQDLGIRPACRRFGVVGLR